VDAARAVARTDFPNQAQRGHLNVVNADPAVQLRLLDLQAADAKLAQLGHRRRTLPELARIAEAAAQAAALHSEAVGLRTEISDIATEQRRMENDIEVVRSRESRDQARLDSGGVPAKELEGLQHELASLQRRQGTLEDAALEVMERREELDAALADVMARAQKVADEQSAAEAARDAEFGEIDAAAGAAHAQRVAIAQQIPADLLALYDKVRAAQGGVGAAAIRARRCEGCRLELAGSELTAARHAAPDEVLRCENCRRIIVRTAESGL
jgi:predicted  nucleic acid-binding Zn-ribbon protein